VEVRFPLNATVVPVIASRPDQVRFEAKVVLMPG